ncbi:MAG: VWA domain-containing protein [Treponema sp.]|nr:VWA domain-containing protein [Treponema sp.]
MNFSIERPWVLYLLILLIPYVYFMSSRFARIMKNLGPHTSLAKDSAVFTRTRSSFVPSTFLRCLAWVMLVLGASGISWGARYVPVQKNGRALSLVFDISHSMEAEDAPGDMTRLTAAANYADSLLEHIPYTSVSVVLAKGDGVVAIPLTEDMEAVRTLLSSLSPNLMTAQGTSLGKGIMTAINSFPVQSSQAATIWLFTDGEETDGSLANALTEAMKFGIPVTIIGFGSEREISVTAGDGKTQVKTALRSETLEQTIASVKEKFAQKAGDSPVTPDIFYIDASVLGSANTVLDSFAKKTGGASWQNQVYGSEDESSVVYELETVDRHNLFILLAIVFIAASFIFAELTIPVTYLKKKGIIASSVVAMAFLFSGCSDDVSDGAKILSGRLNWNRKKYQESVASFMTVAENAEERGDSAVHDYALYNLATTYLMQNENEAAEKRYNEISPDADDKIKFSTLYNLGILSHRNGDYSKATDYFKRALLVDSTSINAKINLELSQSEVEAHARSQEQVLTPVTQNHDEPSAGENSLYSTIREDEQNRWKNQQQETESSELDY